ncbi:helix-turn-helix domain-containing protein [Patescibacteria group bacterium]|nr:helix-turn-helix domain-containing protein [Patescibacteria group bacterium]MCG2701750.1 helix-turn-helix domain-containing protein [Candidatus Parcubacteria bacterium]MBU4264655.1 helix-turn-helix domain-containing protein [Patescibacteria group bacterium]MBU4390610.1 helix-turn-helix domain-containing protein [Patescibacteria group bacterium]MBU4397518.1 helix-turn-helix domain-containing protein [Patescibacteria group bacterium]
MNSFIIRIDPRLLTLTGRVEDIAVLLAMFSFSDNGLGQCYASHRTIAKMAHVSDKTVVSAIKRTGLFEKVGEKTIQGGMVNIYEVRNSYAPLLSQPPKVRNSYALNSRSAEVRSAEVGTKCGRVTDNTLKPIKTTELKTAFEEKTLLKSKIISEDKMWHLLGGLK